MWVYYLLEQNFSFFTPNKARLTDLYSYSRTKLAGGSIPPQITVQNLVLEKSVWSEILYHHFYLDATYYLQNKSQILSVV